MGEFITENGLEIKDYETIVSEREAKYKLTFGNDIDLDPTGIIGQIIALESKKDLDLWEAVQEHYASFNPNEAEGFSLDKKLAEIGLTRQAASKTQVLNTYLIGDEGTVVAAGKKARQSKGDNTDIEYLLLASVTITKTAARRVTLTIGTPSDTEVFTITIDGTPYTDTATVPSDTATDIATNIKALIEAGSFAGTVTQDGAQLTIEDIDLDFNISWTSNITLDELASGGNFEADTAGAFTVPATTLDTIVTTVTGWDAVENVGSGITGRSVETDAEARIRRLQGLVTGNATEAAITRAILNNVTGITQALVFSNRTDITDGSGLPPHSFESVVSGGDEDDIAQQIWLSEGVGIRPHGDITKIVVDSEGNNQTIKFSRPTPKYAHVKVQRDFYAEEEYPTDGDNQIKEEIVAWALINQTLGIDVIRQRLTIPIYEVSGIGSINILIDVTANPGDTPSYAASDFSILAREYADFSTSRIVVEDIP